MYILYLENSAKISCFSANILANRLPETMSGVRRVSGNSPSSILVNISKGAWIAVLRFSACPPSIVSNSHISSSFAKASGRFY